MSKLEWDNTSERYYETGVSKGVIYPMSSGAYQTGKAWNGLTSVNESTDGADITTLYADNIEYLHIASPEKCGFTIECYTYPDEFKPCVGEVDGANGVTFTAQKHASFGFCYRSEVGSEDDEDEGYKIHIYYGCKAKPSEVNRETVNDSPDAVTFSFECSTSPVEVHGLKPTAHIILDSRLLGSARMEAAEDLLYGTSNSNPTLPLPDALATALADVAAG